MNNLPFPFGVLVQHLMFEYASYSSEQLLEQSRKLPPKLLRWLATYHPDNRTRKLFLELTNVSIGEGSVINQGFIVSDDYEPLLTIGKRVAIAPNVMIVCVSSPNNSMLKDEPVVIKQCIKHGAVTIDDDSWIGAGAIILPGVHIGKRCIVGVGSVVTSSFPDGVILAGVPARVTRKIDAV